MSRDVTQEIGVTPFTAVAATLAFVRLGAVVGLWPVVVGPAGIVTENVLPLLLHVLGSAATAIAITVGHRATMLIGLAFTGYSTISLALGAPTQALTALLWVTGVATIVAVGLALLRERGRPQSWGPRTGIALGVLTALVLSSVRS